MTTADHITTDDIGKVLGVRVSIELLRDLGFQPAISGLRTAVVWYSRDLQEMGFSVASHIYRRALDLEGQPC